MLHLFRPLSTTAHATTIVCYRIEQRLRLSDVSLARYASSRIVELLFGAQHRQLPLHLHVFLSQTFSFVAHAGDGTFQLVVFGFETIEYEPVGLVLRFHALALAFALFELVDSSLRRQQQFLSALILVGDFSQFAVQFSPFPEMRESSPSRVPRAVFPEPWTVVELPEYLNRQIRLGRAVTHVPQCVQGVRSDLSR